MHLLTSHTSLTPGARSGTITELEMICNLLLPWALLLLSIISLQAHPVPDSVDMLFSGPDSAEEAGIGGPDELSVSDVNSLLQRPGGLGYSPLFFRQGLKVTGPLPRETLKEVLLEKPGHFSSLSYLLGIRRPYRRRASGADCFWKYCV
ncbi:urotensin 2, alpha [Brachyhypopomus gauderio]|uniref:urotensin 2, alpha n=1 Tax=Brachyhypopomus gauderio TaxID=698409 RepID=UPI004042BECA